MPTRASNEIVLKIRVAGEGRLWIWHHLLTVRHACAVLEHVGWFVDRLFVVGPFATVHETRPSENLMGDRLVVQSKRKPTPILNGRSYVYPCRKSGSLRHVRTAGALPLMVSFSAASHRKHLGSSPVALGTKAAGPRMWRSRTCCSSASSKSALHWCFRSLCLQPDCRLRGELLRHSPVPTFDRSSHGFPRYLQVEQPQSCSPFFISNHGHPILNSAARSRDRKV